MLCPIGHSWSTPGSPIILECSYFHTCFYKSIPTSGWSLQYQILQKYSSFNYIGWASALTLYVGSSSLCLSTGATEKIATVHNSSGVDHDELLLLNSFSLSLIAHNYSCPLTSFHNTSWYVSHDKFVLWKECCTDQLNMTTIQNVTIMDSSYTIYNVIEYYLNFVSQKHLQHDLWHFDTSFLPLLCLFIISKTLII